MSNLLGELKQIPRKETIAGHIWWEFSLPANGFRFEDEACEEWIKERIMDIESTGKWRVDGYTISDSKERLCLLAKDVRKRKFKVVVQGEAQFAISAKDIERALMSLGIKNASISEFEAEQVS